MNPLTDEPTSTPTPEPLPEVPDVPGQIQKLSTSIQDSVNTFLQQTGKNLTDSEAAMTAFIQKLQPIIAQQLQRAAVDPDVAYTNLKYVWATVWAETGRVSLGAIYKERQAVTAIVLAGLRTAIALAVTAA